jgi:N-acetylglucosaminyldiphosphoundecaprenol N-acetyl-beta-D-mannosaminyltransferase
MTVESNERRVSLFGIRLDPLGMDEAVAELLAWVAAGARPCRYVVTPNVDHVVMYQHDAALRAAYADAGLVLADGMPVVLAARWLGKNLPERVAGSDLVPELFTAAGNSAPLKVFLLGAMPGVAARAATKASFRWPHVDVVGTYSPPLGFDRDAAENESILEQIDAAGPDVLIVGLGAPKQELWVHAHRERINASVALCVGATIDFLAGEKARAPRWLQRSGLEWLHRCATEPRRLFARYVRDACIFPQLLYREWRAVGRGR